MPTALPHGKSGNSFGNRVEQFSRDGGASAQPDVPELNFPDILRKIWRRKGVIVTVVCVGLALAIVVVQRTAIRYTATAQVMISPPQNRVVDTQTVTAALSPDQETVEGQILVLQSRRLAERVATELGLEKRPDFNPALAPAQWWRADNWMPQKAIEFLFGPVLPQSDKVRSEHIRNGVIDAFRNRLSVSPIDRSRVLEVGFTHMDPEIAQKAANLLVDGYIEDQQAVKLEANRKATGWLDERLGMLRGKVEETEHALELYRAGAGLTEGKSGIVAVQQLSDLGTQLTLARTKRAEIEANLKQGESILQGRGDIGTLPEALASPLIRSLREQGAQLQRKRAELTQQYSDRHPALPGLYAEIENNRQQTDLEIRRIIQGLRNEAGSLRNREGALADSVRKLEARIGGLNQSGVKLRELERDAAATRALYQNFLTRFTELSEQRDLQSPDAQVISYASLPSSPSSRSPALVVGIALLGSLAAGMGAAATLDRFRRGFHSQEEVERRLLIPALGIIPKRPKRWKRDSHCVLSHFHSAYAEAIRSLYIRLQLPETRASGKVVLISSAAPGEGKTSLSIALAQMAAKAGKKVILVDFDTRKPGVHKALSVDRTCGLTEVLLGEMSLENALRKDEVSGAYILYAGRPTADTGDLLDLGTVRTMISSMRKMADLVILDSAPLTAVGDTFLLAQLADKTVFLIRWARTRCETVSFAVQQLLGLGANISGAVLSHVDVKAHSRYGYGDSGYYYGENRKYYAA